MTITFAIPTFNRIESLKKSLGILKEFILCSTFRDNIKVLISNNGSSDGTSEYLLWEYERFKNLYIDFSFINLETNLGFDYNVYNCYVNAVSDFVWILSDDDVVFTENLDQILNLVVRSNSNVYYFNFEQGYHNRNTPYIVSTECVNDFDLSKAQIFLRVPKLTSFIFRKLPCQYLEWAIDFSFGFYHLFLALYVYQNEGKILFSNYFIAKSEEDYQNKIDFVPYITNFYLNFINAYILKYSSSNYDFSQLTLGHKPVNELEISLIYIGRHYRGDIVIPNTLLKYLLQKIRAEIFTFKNYYERHIHLLIAVLKFFYSKFIFFSFRVS